MNRREQVLGLLKDGKTQKEIGELLGISQDAVRYHSNPKRRAKNIERITEHRRRVKVRAIQYKGGKCHKCGYNQCQDAMVFHHVDPTKKDFGLGSGRTYGWTIKEKELDKTILLCNRCHSELHAGLWNIEDV